MQKNIITKELEVVADAWYEFESLPEIIARKTIAPEMTKLTIMQDKKLATEIKSLITKNASSPILVFMEYEEEKHINAVKYACTANHLEFEHIDSETKMKYLL